MIFFLAVFLDFIIQADQQTADTVERSNALFVKETNF